MGKMREIQRSVLTENGQLVQNVLPKKEEMKAKREVHICGAKAVRTQIRPSATHCSCECPLCLPPV